MGGPRDKKQFNVNKKRATLAPPPFTRSGAVGSDSEGEDQMKRYAKIAKNVGKGFHPERRARLVKPEDEPLVEASKPGFIPNTPEFPTEMYNQLGELASRGRGADPVLTSIRIPAGGSGDKNLLTVFAREDDVTVNERKATARNPLATLPLTATQLYKTVIPIPRRPAWKGLSKVQLHSAEEREFGRWLQTIYTQYPTARLNKFEHNLNVWRQLWRVCDKSDVVVMVADARQPLLHFSPGLYDEVVHHLRKPMVLVLNKIDLVPPEVLASWKIFFRKQFPFVELAFFSSYPSTYLRSVFGELVADKYDKGDLKAGDEDHEDDEDELVDPISLGSTVDISDKKSNIVSTLSSHAAQVLKMKKSPIIIPVGAEGVLECCRRVFLKYVLSQIPDAKVSSVTNLVESFITLDSNRIVKASDRERLQALSEEKEKEAEELREKLLQQKMYKKLKEEEQEAEEDEEETEEEEDDDESDVEEDGSSDEDGSDGSSDDSDSEFDEVAAMKILMGRSSKRSKKAQQKKNRQKAIASEGQIKAWDSEEEDTKQHYKANKNASATATADKAAKNGRPAPKKKQDDSDDEDDGIDQTAAGYLSSDNEGGSDDDEDKGKRTDFSTPADIKKFFVNKTKFVLGMVGHPNAGKSSLINALTGKKVVSVSRQPGHTKHLQTILINDNCLLCDCPGLVFPASDISSAIQVVSGITPIPQARELFTAVQHIGERIKLQKLLGLDWACTEEGMRLSGFSDAKEMVAALGTANGDEESSTAVVAPNGKKKKKPIVPEEKQLWSAEDILHAYAVKRGFLNAKGRANFNQAAQAIVYMVVDGKIPFFATPPAIEENEANIVIKK